jgi:CBS domain containing-hemolysin-like protein
MIHDALETADTTVREIMTPRPYFVWLPDISPVAHVLTVALRSGHSRIPLYGPGADSVTGVVHVKDLLPSVMSRNLRSPAVEMAEPPYFVPDVKPVSELLSEMRRLDVHLAIVLDEYGGIAGLVTLEDVVEEIVGDISDEFDRLEPAAQAADGGHVFAARTRLEEVDRFLPLPIPKPSGVRTLGGLVYALAGRVPAQGEAFLAGPWLLTAQEIRGPRILKVKVTKAKAGKAQ